MEGHCVTQRQIVNEKLRILRQQKKDVSKYLDEVLKIGRAWVDVGDQTADLGFVGTCQLIDNTSQLVASVCSQMAVAACDKKPVSKRKAKMKETAASISKIPQTMEKSLPMQEHNSELTELKENMEQMNEKHNKTSSEMDKRISDLEQTVHDLIKTQSGNKTHVRSGGKKKETHEDKKNRDDVLLCKLMMDVENMQGEFKELKTQIACWQSLEDCKRLSSVQPSEKQNNKLPVLSDTEMMLKELFENLSRKVTSNSETISTMSSEQKKWRDMLQYLDREMEEVQRNVEVVMKKCDPTGTDVNGRERKSEEIESSASILSQPETTNTKEWIGFAAKLSGELYLKKCQMAFIEEGNILNFTLIFNRGFFFDPAVGKFTARRGGVYLICLTMHQYHDGQVVLHVTKRPDKCQRSEFSCVYSHKYCVLEMSTNKDLGNDCLFSVVELKDGDDLYVRAAEVDDDPLLTDRTVFSCFLLS